MSEDDATGRSPMLRWPPPGLERLQGDLWRVAARGAMGGATLVLPLLFVAARGHDISSLGPFADAWWVSLVLAAVGLGFAVDALTSAGRLLRRASRAVEGGYDLRTVLYVAADLRRDMGFLLQGGRHFSVMSERDRETVANFRLLAATCHAVAGLWLPVVMAVALLLAARGALDHTAVWVLTLIPAGALYVLGGLVGLLEDGRVRKARRAWFAKPWATDLEPAEISAWLAEMSGDGARGGYSRLAVNLRRAALVAGFFTVLVVVPILTLIPTSAVGPVLARLAIPRFEQAQKRAAEAEAYRGMRVATDDAISSEEAGVLLHELLFVGSDRPPVEGEVEPRRRFPTPWIPAVEGGNPLGAEPHRWAEVIFERVAEDPSPEVLAYLRAIAEHPAQETFARLAHAPALDAASGRWGEAFPAGLKVASVPIPRLSGVREAAFARIAAAAWDDANGRRPEAEEKLREVISVGFLLGDEGPTLIENLIGHVLITTGGTALANFFRATGRERDAAAIGDLTAAADRAAARVHQPPAEGVEAFVRSLPAMVEDTALVRGFRWEYFILTTTLTPCLNLHRMVFGPDEAYRAFEERAHAALVRYPSEEKLFDLARAGYWGGTDPANESLFGRFLGIAMRPGPGTCANVVRRFDTLREAM